jgi:hypothetical protein
LDLSAFLFDMHANSDSHWWLLVAAALQLWRLFTCERQHHPRVLFEAFESCTYLCREYMYVCMLCTPYVHTYLHRNIGVCKKWRHKWNTYMYDEIHVYSIGNLTSQIHPNTNHRSKILILHIIYTLSKPYIHTTFSRWFYLNSIFTVHT